MYKHLVPAKLLELAAVVRRVFEAEAEREYYPSNLCGYCARSSLQLFRLATLEGIRVDICYGQSHVFLVVPVVLVEAEGEVLDLVLDVTATQFGSYDKVQVAPLREMADKNYAWCMSDRVKSLEEFQKGWGWEGEEVYRWYATAVDSEMALSQPEVTCSA